VRWLIRYDGLACQFYIIGKEKRKRNIPEIELVEKYYTDKRLKKEFLNLVDGN
jgi:hypothetical protein